MSNSRGQLFIVSAPSGTGKTTLVKQLVLVTPKLQISRSYTSRSARSDECDGVDYNFVTRERFDDMVRSAAFLEWTEVFGNYYGTCAEDVERVLTSGDDLVLIIEVQGANQIRARAIPHISIFVLPPSAAILRQRLKGRSKDSEDQIRRRLNTASQEIGELAAYDYLIINDKVEQSVEQLQAIIVDQEADEFRVEAMKKSVDSVVKTF
jgi:guanylate kinase